MMILSFAKKRMRFAKSSCFIATVFLLATIADAPAAVVKADGFQLKLNGQPFVIKGMNYSPVPIGTAPGIIPYGDYFVPAYANVWKPDIDKIRDAGINVIKLYAGNPDLNAGVPDTAGNWKQFLDYCYNDGRKPVYVVMFSYTQGGVIEQGGPGFFDYIRHYDALVKSTVKHPAVFGYMIGNEIFGGVTQSPRFWQNFGTLINAAQGAGLSRGQNPFLTTAVNDEFTPQTSWPGIKLGEQSGKLKNLDAWCINTYRGPTFGGSGNSVFTQYLALMNSFSLKKPLILGEWGTPHTTRPAPGSYGQNVALPITNLDDVPESQMGMGKPYFAAQPVATFLDTQWDTIKANLKAGDNQVCAGGFIFDWCDEYWKANNNNVQQGGPDTHFNRSAFAGNYWDEAGFGVTSAVDQSAYGPNKPNISRTLFKGYHAVKTFYSASSELGDELYLTGAQLRAIRSDVREEIRDDQNGLDALLDVEAPDEASIHRFLQVEIAVLQARLAYPADKVLEQLDQLLDRRTSSLGQAAKRRILARLKERLRELRAAD
jgi:hypothetical protein